MGWDGDKFPTFFLVINPFKSFPSQTESISEGFFDILFFENSFFLGAPAVTSL